MSDLPPYPLPSNLAKQAEVIMQAIPDREDTVFHLREFFGRVYAEGYRDGRLAHQFSAHFDKAASDE